MPTTPEQRIKTAKITRHYLVTRTLQAFASGLGADENISRQSVFQWAKGQHTPDPLMLNRITRSPFAEIWARQWAEDCLAVLLAAPEPTTEG
jgi:hypothetical protein